MGAQSEKGAATAIRARLLHAMRGSRTSKRRRRSRRGGGNVGEMTPISADGRARWLVQTTQMEICRRRER